MTGFAAAWGVKPLLAITLLHRSDTLARCGLAPDEVQEVVALGERIRLEADALRRVGDARLRKGDVAGVMAGAPADNARVAALAAAEAEGVDTIAGERGSCVRDLLADFWEADRARGVRRRDAVTVTCNVFATQFDANTSDEVAIPDYCIKFANLGWGTCSSGYASPPYEVDITHEGHASRVWVGDVGPWNIDDNYWNLASDPARPRRLFTDLAQCWNEARAAYYDDYNGGQDQYGRSVSNPAGLDLATEIAGSLGLAYLENDWVDLTFPWEGYATYPALSLAIAQDPRPDQPPDTRGGDGVYDVYPGQTWTVRVTVTNGGDDRAEGTTLALVAQDGLAVDRWDVWSDYPYGDRASWAPNDANDDPANPAHDGPGSDFRLTLGGLAPGESKMTTLTVRATEVTDGLPELRAWVAHVDGIYEKADWDAAPTNVDGAQTWNGGDLRIAAAHDVWPSRIAWDFEDGTAQGWWVGNAATTSVTGGHLDVHVEGTDPQVISGWFQVAAGPGDTLSLTVNNGTPGADGRVYWATRDAESFAEDRALPVALPLEAGWHDVVVDLGAAPGWSGTPTRLRLDPGGDGTGTLLLASVSLDAALDTGDPGLPAAEVVADDAGCGCGASRGAAWLGLPALALVVRRRPRTAPDQSPSR